MGLRRGTKRHSCVLAALSLPILLLAGVACTSPPTVDDDDSVQGGDDDDSLSPKRTATVSGHVIDEAGNPVAELLVSLCGEVCLIEPTGADGRFLFEGVAAGVKVLEPTLVPAGDDLEQAVRSWTRFFDLVEVGEGEALELPTPFVLRRVAGAQGPLVGSSSFDLLPELRVTVDADAVLEHGPLPVGAEDIWLGAVAIPQDAWPQGGLQDWTVKAAWGLAIWDLEAEDAFEVIATLPEPIDTGAEVAFLVADYTFGFSEGRFFEEAAQLDAEGSTMRTAPGGGLDRATMWLAVSRNP